MCSLYCHRFSRFERFQEAVDHAGGARIALGGYFTPQLQTIATAGLPALEDIGGVVGTLPCQPEQAVLVDLVHHVGIQPQGAHALEAGDHLEKACRRGAAGWLSATERSLRGPTEEEGIMVGTVVLTVNKGITDGTEWVIKAPATCVIGRSSECGVRVPDRGPLRLE